MKPAFAVRTKTLWNSIESRQMLASMFRSLLSSHFIVSILCILNFVTTLRATESEAPLPPINITIDGVPVTDLKAPIRIPSNTKTIMFSIGDKVWEDQNSLAPRFRYIFQGVDSTWQWRTGQMGLGAFFLNQDNDLLNSRYFMVTNDSPHWDGTLNRSNLIHRVEKLVVPLHAQKLSLVISSAGPPDTYGTYALEGLVVTRKVSNGMETLLRLAPSPLPMKDQFDKSPEGWVRDGTHPAMAQVVSTDAQNGETEMLYVKDDDPLAHAEWHLRQSYYPQVHPGEELTLEWNEMYSVGLCDMANASYSVPKAGEYRFRVSTLDVMGNPLRETSFKIIVYTPYWMSPWFWSILVGMGSVVAFYAIRHLVRMSIRKQIQKIEQAHLIERERLRIARDLHDDLGARLTHISLVSSSATKGSASLDHAHENFKKISEMSRELISALYETVWTVDPGNDHLDALVSHLIQMIDALCGAASIPCRISASKISENIPVNGSLRHNVSMAIKEILHNALKHSQASEIRITFRWAQPLLTVYVSDNGQGFDIDTAKKGRGLKNIRERITTINGECLFQSRAGHGTEVTLKIPISS